jgi:hypothetical protein
MKSFLFISCFLVLLGCTTDAAQSRKLPKEPNEAQNVDLKIDEDKFFRSNYPNTEYLQPGIYKGEAYFRDEDELEQDFLNDTWLGIFKTKQNWYLLPVKPQIETVFDGIVDDTEADTANWSGKIMSSAKNCRYVLRKGSLQPKQLKVLYADRTSPTFHDEKSVLLPGDTLQFEVNGLHYWVYAKGRKLPKEEGLDDQRFGQYALYLETDDPIQEQKVQLLRSTDPSYEYGPNRLECLFVGLIDADAIPDLIISSNFDGRILYLSGEAKEQRIVEPVFYEPMTGGC